MAINRDRDITLTPKNGLPMTVEQMCRELFAAMQVDGLVLMWKGPDDALPHFSAGDMTHTANTLAVFLRAEKLADPLTALPALRQSRAGGPAGAGPRREE
jgi:hypothetical protein